jgi:hypothetical protein
MEISDSYRCSYGTGSSSVAMYKEGSLEVLLMDLNKGIYLSIYISIYIILLYLIYLIYLTNLSKGHVRTIDIDRRIKNVTYVGDIDTSNGNIDTSNGDRWLVELCDNTTSDIDTSRGLLIRLSNNNVVAVPYQLSNRSIDRDVDRDIDRDISNAFNHNSLLHQSHSSTRYLSINQSINLYINLLINLLVMVL